jgi:hypothetical protein
MGINASEYTIGFEHPVALPMSIAAERFHVLTDLGVHLFVNGSREKFITSDHPVVIHNQFCQGITMRGVLGWNSSGIQIIFPISPRRVIFLYDTSIYTVGAGRKQNVKKLTSLAEVKNINAFQILNAESNIYFLDEAMKNVVIRSVEQLSEKRKIKRNILVQTEMVDDDGMSAIIHQYERIIPLSFDVVSVRIRKPMRRLPLSTRGSMYRHRAPFSDEAGGRRHGQHIRYPVRRSFED